MTHNYVPSKVFQNTYVCTICYKKNYWPLKDKDETECGIQNRGVNLENYIIEVLHEHFKK